MQRDTMQFMANPKFTRDPHRIGTLLRNYHAGVEREKLDRTLREQEDKMLVRPSRQDVLALHARAATARVQILERKRGGTGGRPSASWQRRRELRGCHPGVDGAVGVLRVLRHGAATGGDGGG